MPNELKIIENKVNGCLSTVYIHAILQPDNTVYYYGDSDALLTKGLVSILVQGLSNSKVDDILLVEPEFLKYSGLATSLTPGRNNGFLNMLNLMKLKAKELSSTENIVDSSENNKQNNFIIKEDVLLNDNKNINLVKDVESSIESNSINSSDRPIYNSIVKKLSMLKPISLEVIDESYLHANHQAMKELSSSESHFKVIIVASCFNNLTLVQRHKMIYTLLSNELKNGVHALSIVAKTPNE